MIRRMLINAAHEQECRVAVVEDGQLLELEIERPDQIQLKGNIYKAAITRVEPSLQAAFLDIGANRNGFLQINDIHPAYFKNWPPEGGHHHHHSRPAIQDVLHANQELIVQVVKDERDLKGATLTTNISIPGRYLVLMVGNQRGGVSRKISDEMQRSRLKQALGKITVPAGMGVIVRTAGINRSSGELQRDLDGLLDIWCSLVQKSQEPGHPQMLYKESDIAIRCVRDYLTGDIDEILIDDAAVFQRVSDFVEKVMPNFRSRVVFYDSPRPLFSNFDLDNQVEAVNQPEVALPSGGSIVMNVTEAIVAVDVNSGRSTSQSDVEQTAFKTNKEAAIEIARQLRLRDLGGLIVIDFIDMGDKRHKQTIERVLKDSVRFDKAKVEIGRISKFGLLEMSRQRLKASLVSQSHVVCPHCTGRGRVKTPETAALEALRKIESAVFAGGVGEVKVRMAPAAALFVLNEKRQALSRLENLVGINIRVYADGRLRPEEYELTLGPSRKDFAPSTPALGNPERPAGREEDQTGSGDRRGQRRDGWGGDTRRYRNQQHGHGSGRGDRRRNRRGRNRGRSGNYRGAGPRHHLDRSEHRTEDHGNQNIKPGVELSSEDNSQHPGAASRHDPQRIRSDDPQLD